MAPVPTAHRARPSLSLSPINPSRTAEPDQGARPMNSFSQYVMEQARRRGAHIRLARAARRYGLDVREASKHPDLVDFINDRKIDVVLDIGANSGQFGEKLRGFGYRSRYRQPSNTSMKLLSQMVNGRLIISR
jgi:hypothetical protein